MLFLFDEVNFCFGRVGDGKRYFEEMIKYNRLSFWEKIKFKFSKFRDSFDRRNV